MMGVPYGWELVDRTRPYYRSTYVFVTRRDRHLRVHSFDDPVLRRPSLRIGVQLIGDDYENTPPVEALSNRGIVGHLVGYSVVGDYGEADPPARIVEAVARGDVDVAIVWGPLAGYFAARQPVALDLVPVAPQVDVPFMPFVFDIAVGVAHGRAGLRDTLDAALERRRADIARLLAAFRVPVVPVGGR
jgi:mxaJ protein